MIAHNTPDDTTTLIGLLVNSMPAFSSAPHAQDASDFWPPAGA